MQLKIYNTLHNRQEIFQPLDPTHVKLYVCGPTVYDLVHIGNGRPAVVFDILYRLLQTIFPRVSYARNITDIDDKINTAAAQAGEPISVLTERYTQAYLQDVAALGVLEPTHQPRATEHINEIILIIEQLIARGHAYVTQQHVLFDVQSDPNYGCLSNRSLEDMRDGARVEVAPYKKDPKDFVLWKPSTAELPGWPSPWGFGRPGWHIECTAMIHAHLGSSIDIHGGGSDLAFPHHENEIAQGTCAQDNADYVRYWMHNGMLNFADAQGRELKMSKSLGNIVSIRELLQQHHGEVLRYALLSGHYRSSLPWNHDLLVQSKASLDRFYQALANTEQSQHAQTAANFAAREIHEYPDSVSSALADDLNTAKALAAMHEIAGQLNKATESQERNRLVQQLLAAGWLMGLLTETPQSYFHTGRIDELKVQQLIEQRLAAKSEGDYTTADQIRNTLDALGVQLQDTPSGTQWRLKR